MLLSGAIYQFSFAYDILKRRDPTKEEATKGITNVLQELEVFEISVVTVPANQNAVTTEVKATTIDGQELTMSSKDFAKYSCFIKETMNNTEGETPEHTKQGKRNSQKDEDVIRQAVAQMTNCIKSLESLLETSEEDKPTEPDASEEAEPEVNEASKEQRDEGNSKRAEDILSKINSIKGDS